MRTTIRTACLALGAASLSLAAQAAGGHHGVDDAEILSRGECELETWGQRFRGGDRVLHTGVQCGVGPVELGLAGEFTRNGPSGSANQWNLEVKWARELAEGFSIGAVLQPVWQAHQRPRHAGTVVALLASWSPREEWAVHANLGRDFLRAASDEGRGGIALEWKPAPAWSLLAERYLESDTHFGRAGARWHAGKNWSLDLSRAHRISGPTPSHWTLGLTLGFGD